MPRRTHKQGTFPETTRHLLAPRVPTERLPFPLRRAVSARSSPCWARPEDNQSIQLVEPTGCRRRAARVVGYFPVVPACAANAYWWSGPGIEQSRWDAGKDARGLNANDRANFAGKKRQPREYSRSPTYRVQIPRVEDENFAPNAVWKTTRQTTSDV